MSEIAVDVRQIIANTLECSLEKVTPTSKLIEDLRGDSLSILDIVLMLENEFKITIDEVDEKTLEYQLYTVQDLISLVEKLVSEKSVEH